MSDKPNILIIITDQLSRSALGCYGNKDVSSPHIDALAQSGVRFNKAYTPCPLCMPARASFWSGTLPHDTWTVSNAGEYKNGTVGEEVPTLGSLFKGAGYETIHFGKTHDNGTLRGFDCVDTGKPEIIASDIWPEHLEANVDELSVKAGIDYLNQTHDKPFVMIEDLHNPHGICNWIGTFREEHDDHVHPPGKLPDLPDNFDVMDLEKRPLPIQYLCCSHSRQSMVAPWTEENYRHYLAAYYYYVHRADTHVGMIMDALKKSGAAENTLIVFAADHGDNMGSHRMVTKQVAFYEETTRVPMIFSGPGIAGKNISLDSLVSLSDLMPTLCDYAGLNVPEGLYGKSVLLHLKGELPVEKREYVASEWMTEWGHTIEPGRMIRTENYKYTRYIEGDGEELYDLVNDPGETHTLIDDPDYQQVLESHRRLLREHVEKENDPFFSLESKVDKQWRSHPVGYHHHKSHAAPRGHYYLGRDDVMASRASKK